MIANRIIDHLPEFTPALADIADLSGPALHTGQGIEGFEEDLERLSALPEFERSPWSRVIPVNGGLNAAPHCMDLGTDERGRAYDMMSLHGEIRKGLGQGVIAMEHLADYASTLDIMKTLKAGRAVRAFAELGIVRATQIDLRGWRRGRGEGHDDVDGEGLYIARHRDSYRTLRPLMSGKFRRLADQAITAHS